MAERQRPDGRLKPESKPTVVTWGIPKEGVPVVKENFGGGDIFRPPLPKEILTRSSEFKK